MRRYHTDVFVQSTPHTHRDVLFISGIVSRRLTGRAVRADTDKTNTGHTTCHLAAHEVVITLGTTVHISHVVGIGVPRQFKQSSKGVNQNLPQLLEVLATHTVGEIPILIS